VNDGGAWPTPTATERPNDVTATPSEATLKLYKEGKINRIRKTRAPTLTTAVKLATPQSRDYRVGETSRWENPNRSNNLNDQIGGSLNPDWVEWIMGIPIGWSSTEPLNKEQYIQWLNLMNKKEWWIQEPFIPRQVKGMKGRINRIKMLGNGIVPATLGVFLNGKG